jgi:hypothetical protein
MERICIDCKKLLPLLRFDYLRYTQFRSCCHECYNFRCLKWHKTFRHKLVLVKENLAEIIYDRMTKKELGNSIISREKIHKNLRR